MNAGVAVSSAGLAEAKAVCSPALWEEYEAVTQEIALGNLCVDGEPCDFERVDETYGEDRDGNRGIWVHYYRCHKCGDER